MRIILEPTEMRTGSAEEIEHRVVIEHAYDGLRLEHVMRLVAAALVAYGYSRTEVEEWIEGEEPYRIGDQHGESETDGHP